MVCLPDDERRQMRLAFWKNWLSEDSPYRQAREDRLNPDRPLPGWIENDLPPEVHRIRVLDLKAGPITALGTASQRCSVELVPVDDLAYHFDEMLAAGGIEPLIRTRFCNIADVPATFGPTSFDYIYTFNGLDFSLDPVAHYKSLLSCLKPHGKLITFHEAKVAEDRFHREAYRYFHTIKNGRICLRQKNFRRDLQDCLPGAQLSWEKGNGLIRLEISAQQETVSVVKPRRLREGEKLPKLVSMHIPKTAGSSFRSFLEGLYGPSLRCMYNHEETHPDLIPKLELDPEVRCLHGHFPADAYDGVFPDALKITWLRNPVERVASSYFQFHRHPEIEDKSDFNQSVYKKGWSLMEFARKEEIRQQMLWYINATPMEAFFFVGISERYEESIQLLCHLFNVPAPETNITINTNPDRSGDQGYFLTPAQRLELEALYAVELEVYQLANYRLDQQLKQAFGK